MKAIAKFKFYLFLLLLMNGLVGTRGVVRAQEFVNVNETIIDRVRNFESHITINKDASISVRETIVYETNLKKHGIYRYIPYFYKSKGLVRSARIKDIQVTDEKGDKIQFVKKKRNGNVFLKIGNPDKTFTGRKIYKISYRVVNAVRRFDNHDELYWDITGEGWHIKILDAKVVVKSPYAEITAVRCYSGVVGSNDGQCKARFSSHEAQFSYGLTIENGVNMTVAVALSQRGSQIVFPSWLERAMMGVRDNIILLIIILPSVMWFYYWWRKGRDWQFVSDNVFDLDENKPQRLVPMFKILRTPFVYEPLQITPGEAGVVLDQKADNQDVVAEIIELARKKYLQIKTIEEKKGFRKVKDYVFKKLKDGDEQLAEHQKYLLKALFARKDEVALSSLKGTFYRKMDKAKNMIYKSTVEKKLFTSDPSSMRIRSMMIASIVNIGICTLGRYAVNQYLTTLPLALAMGLAVVNFVLAWSMPQRTAKGTAYAMQAKGLRATIKRGKWREEIKEKHLFIEKILPFAISLGVVKQLVRAMKDLDIKPPEYLEDSLLSNMTVGDFLGDFSSQTASGLAYNPASSSASSGSGFSGGSSGGGGGGGGGGSW